MLPASLARRLRRTTEIARRWKLRSANRVVALPETAGIRKAARLIAIIGAGVSGLATGYLLSQAGEEVAVFEARKQPGGRVLTLRTGFASGVYAEAGAARISDAHSLTHAWIKHFELALEPMYPDSGTLIGAVKDQLVAGADAARLSSHDIHYLLVGHMPWGAQWPASRSARVLVRNSFTKPTWSRISGGMDKLTLSFADQLNGKIRYNAAVFAITQDSEGVDIHFRKNNAIEKMRADVVVCAVPPSVLRSIRLSPPMPRDKQILLEQSRTVSATRVFLQLGETFPMPSNSSGFGIIADNWEMWQQRFPTTGRRLLVVYAKGDASAPLAALAPENRIAAVTEHLRSLFPTISEHCEATAQVCWDENPWSLGAQETAKANLDVSARVDGRVHFAGVHTSSTGWIEGALESASRVTAEILRET